MRARAHAENHSENEMLELKPAPDTGANKMIMNMISSTTPVQGGLLELTTSRDRPA
jgi:hypothetical protein